MNFKIMLLWYVGLERILFHMVLSDWSVVGAVYLWGEMGDSLIDDGCWRNNNSKVNKA